MGDHFRDKPDHVIITGGSSGIGLALAKLYLLRGSAVTLVARSLDRLQAVAAALDGEQRSRLGLRVADVRDFDDLSHAVAAAEAQFGACDLLITSAGVVEPCVLADLAIDSARRQIEINLLGSIHAARLLAGPMARRGGRILFISSGAALIGLPGYSVYCASKSALVGFAESLRMEAAGTGLHVAICYPPDTDTPQLAAELPARSEAAQRVMGTVKPWSAERVAGVIARGLERRRHEIHFGLTLRLLGRFGSLVRPCLYWWYGRGGG